MHLKIGVNSCNFKDGVPDLPQNVDAVRSNDHFYESNALH